MESYAPVMILQIIQRLLVLGDGGSDGNGAGAVLVCVGYGIGVWGASSPEMTKNLAQMAFDQ